MSPKLFVAATLSAVLCPTLLFAADITGKVVVDGTVPKMKVIDMSKEPACAKEYTTPPTTQGIEAGPGNALEDVVVYVSAGASDDSAAPAQAVSFDQKGCRYIPHVIALKVNQEMKISNEDPTSHNIHPLPKLNREWNKSQPPGAPPIVTKFDQAEFIPVKCNIHPWMHSTFAVLKTSHFDVTKNDGGFDLKGLPPGKYTITAWQEMLGTQSQDVTVGAGPTKPIVFTFKSK